MRIEEAGALRPSAPGRFAWDVPDGWQQGRGAWGGLVAYGVGSAVAASEPSADRALRTLSIHIPGALQAGPASVSVEPLRVGSGMSTWQVRVEQGDEVRAHAVAITGQSRDLPEDLDAVVWGTAERPVLPPWRDVAAIPPVMPGLPVFMQHLELRPARGIPFTDAPTHCTGYVRYREGGSWSAQSLLAIVDAWYPSALPAMPGLRPMATVSFAAHLLLDPTTLDPSEPLLYEGSMSTAFEGFTSELRRLWTPDGRLAVENHQSIVVIS